MQFRVDLTDGDVDRIAKRVAELLGRPDVATVWLDVAGAASHLAITEHGVRGLVKREQIPVHRTENGRVRFDRAELDAWARGATTNADLR